MKETPKSPGNHQTRTEKLIMLSVGRPIGEWILDLCLNHSTFGKNLSHNTLQRGLVFPRQRQAPQMIHLGRGTQRPILVVKGPTTCTLMVNLLNPAGGNPSLV